MDIGSEESLDPKNWEEVRKIGHQMVDDMIQYLRTARDRKTWLLMPDEVKMRLEEPIPREPTPLENVYEQFQQDILTYALGNTHPRFWGWVFAARSQWQCAQSPLFAPDPSL